MGIRAFLEDFQALEQRLRLALLRTILETAHIHRDGRIELEFRT